MRRLRALAAVLALGAILGQAGSALAFPALHLGLDARDDDGTYVVVCTEHGVTTIRLEDGEPAPAEPSEHADHAISCPICLSAASGAVAILPTAYGPALMVETTGARPSIERDVPVGPTVVARYGRAPPLHA